MPLDIEQIKKYLGGGGDISSLTDEELKNRLSAFQALSGGSYNKFDPGLISILKGIEPTSISSEQIINKPALLGEIQRMTSNLFTQSGVKVSEEAVNSASQALLDNIQNPNFQRNNFVDIIAKSSPNLSSQRPIIGSISDQVISNYRLGLPNFYTNREFFGGDFSGSQKQIQELLGLRTKKAAAQKDIENLVSQLPGQLGGATEEFLKSQTEGAGRTLEEVLKPEILAGLNIRGLESSGDLESALTSEAGGLTQSLQNQALELQKADDDFFKNAAYQVELNKVLVAGGDVGAQTEFDRQQALTAQKERFSASQTNLQHRLMESLLRRQQERALAKQEAQLKRQKELSDKSFTSGLISSLGSSVGLIGGTALGSKLAGNVIGTTKK